MVDAWAVVASVPPLPEGVIHVWQANADALAAREHEFARVLDPGERARGDAFHFSADRIRHVVSHGVLRVLAAAYTGAPPSAVGFQTGEFGKPRLASSTARLSFNMSHSGDVVLFAFARGGHVGVDVEQWNARIGEVERERIGHSVFTARERAAIAAVPTSLEKERAFYTLWSRKEAYLKGTGAGISNGLAHVEMSIDDPARLIEDRRDTNARAVWEMLDLDVGASHAAALAFTPGGQAVVLFRVPSHPF